MAEEKFETRVRIGDFHKERYLMIELKDIEDGKYEISTAYLIKNMNNEELIESFISKLKELDKLGYVIHYQI